MQVPPGSSIYKLYFDGKTAGDESLGTENLSIWRHSDGTSLANIKVQVQARRLLNSVVAIVNPENG